MHFCYTFLILIQGATIRYKLDREKCRFTYAPVLAVNGPLAGFKPMIISKVKGTRSADQVRVETKKNCKRFRRIYFGTTSFSNLRLVYKPEGLDDRRPISVGNGQIGIVFEKESSWKTLWNSHG